MHVVTEFKQSVHCSLNWLDAILCSPHDTVEHAVVMSLSLVQSHTCLRNSMFPLTLLFLLLSCLSLLCNLGSSTCPLTLSTLLLSCLCREYFVPGSITLPAPATAYLSFLCFRCPCLHASLYPSASSCYSVPPSLQRSLKSFMLLSSAWHLFQSLPPLPCLRQF